MTISDIAKLAGVSVATVSRVLNNKGYVKAETRKRFEEVIAQKGYHPNAVARSLILNDTGMLAVIMSNRMNPFFSGVLEAVEHFQKLDFVECAAPDFIQHPQDDGAAAT